MATLLCDCSVRLQRADGKSYTIKSRRWDCPSCGRDKASKIRDMVIAQGVDRLLVFTFRQPEVSQEIPNDYSECDPGTHLYLHDSGRWLWRRLETCPSCCRATSSMLSTLRKRMRRRWGNDVQMLWVREVKPRSGAFDYNVIVSGVPVLTRRGREGRWLKAQWSELGGGFLDLGGSKASYSTGGLGRYVGKYLTKLAHRPMAKHYRRWGRSREFASAIRMVDPIYGPRERPMTYTIVGWLDPLSQEVIPYGMRPVFDLSKSGP